MTATERMQKARDARNHNRVSSILDNQIHNKNQLSTLKRVLTAAPRYAGVFRKAYSGKSKVAALKSKCLECSNLQRIEVAECQVEGCPLWQYRPYQHNAGRTGRGPAGDAQHE